MNYFYLYPMLAGLGQLTFYLKHTYLGRLNYYSTQLDLRCTDHIRYEGREILFILVVRIGLYTQGIKESC